MTYRLNWRVAGSTTNRHAGRSTLTNWADGKPAEFCDMRRQRNCAYAAQPCTSECPHYRKDTCHGTRPHCALRDRPQKPRKRGAC